MCIPWPRQAFKTRLLLALLPSEGGRRASIYHQYSVNALGVKSVAFRGELEYLPRNAFHLTVITFELGSTVEECII